jgi:hypothetical protein
MFDKDEILKNLDSILESWKASHTLAFPDEAGMKRVVRRGKVVRKVKVKKKGYKVVRKGSQVKFVRMTQREKRTRRVSARKAWRKQKSARKVKTKRTMIRSKVRMKSLYGK